MKSMKKNANRKRLIPADQAGSYIDTDTVLRRNRILESSGLDNFLIRLPRLKIHTHFYYKFVEDGECLINEHAHWHWEIARIASGSACYPVPEKGVIYPDAAHYLVMPPKITHGWEMTKAPLLINSWQVKIEAEDEIGFQTLEKLEGKVIDSRFLVPASSAQVQAEALLWQMSGDEGSPQLFGSILSGFARIVIGDLMAKINPWPQDLLTERHDSEVAAETLANRLRGFMDENLENPITLSDLEGHFHYSERHLNRVFQQVHKVSIGQYLRQRRMELAKRWLETTSRAVKDIAFSLGYNNPGQFCRYFNIQQRMTPSQYREHQRNNSNDLLRNSALKSKK
jgi:AraC-like DNA-binding protein